MAAVLHTINHFHFPIACFLGYFPKIAIIGELPDPNSKDHSCEPKFFLLAEWQAAWLRSSDYRNACERHTDTLKSVLFIWKKVAMCATCFREVCRQR